MQSNAPQFLPEQTSHAGPSAAPPPEPQAAPPTAQAPAPVAAEVPPAGGAPASGAASTLNTDMMNEIIDNRPLWKRGKFLSVLTAAAALAIGIYWFNRGGDASATAVSEQSDEQTFEVNEAQQADHAEASPAAPAAKPLFVDKQPELTPVPKGLQGAAAAAGLAFAKETGDADAEAQPEPPVAAKSQTVSDAPKAALAAAPKAQSVMRTAFASANAKPETTTETKAALTGAPMIHFAYDSWKLTSATKAELDRLARHLKADKLAKLRIEGHADERGTERYNFELGMKRAKAAKRYLVAKGISAKRLTTVSFGKTRPLAKGHDEATWAQNRRVEMRSAAMLLSRR